MKYLRILQIVVFMPIHIILLLVVGSVLWLLGLIIVPILIKTGNRKKTIWGNKHEPFIPGNFFEANIVPSWPTWLLPFWWLHLRNPLQNLRYLFKANKKAHLIGSKEMYPNGQWRFRFQGRVLGLYTFFWIVWDPKPKALIRKIGRIFKRDFSDRYFEFNLGFTPPNFVPNKPQPVDFSAELRWGLRGKT